METIKEIKQFKCLKNEIYEIKDKSKKIRNRNFVIMACHSGSKEKLKICVGDNLVVNLVENIKIGDIVGIRRNKETRKFYQKPLPICPKCQENYSKDKFIEGILYEAGGSWDEKYK